MNNLENILEISTAIRHQKSNREILVSIVQDLFNQKKSFSDTDSNTKNKEEDIINLLPKKNMFKREENTSYDHNSFLLYLSAFKNKVYDYYTRFKKKIKKSFQELVYSTGYKDKLLTEIEDWGVIYFKTVYQNLSRLSPFGKMYREMQKLWICITRKIK